jgi:hypothetical protein
VQAAGQFICKRRVNHPMSLHSSLSDHCCELSAGSYDQKEHTIPLNPSDITSTVKSKEAVK